MDKQALTVIILTFNEADNIAACLDSVDGVDDVIVVDSDSSDATLETAQSARTDVRCFTHPFRDFGDQRNWALENTSPKNEWILFLDADERMTKACADEIASALRSGGNVGYYLTCRNFFLGTWIKHCTFYPSWQLRLLKKGAVCYRKEGHGQREVSEGPLGYIREPYDHFGFSKGIGHWMERHNEYSTQEVELITRLRNEPLQLTDLVSGQAVVRRRALKRLAARAGFRPLTRFVYTYFLRLGFLDGMPGLIFCCLRVGHEISITAKLWEAEFAADAEGDHKGGVSS